MRHKLGDIINELENVRTIELAVNSTKILERLVWILFGVLGIGWAVYFLPNQYSLWGNNPSLISLKHVPLSDLDYPSVTLVPQRITKNAIAERLGNYLKSNHLPKDFKELRKKLFKFETLRWGDYDYTTDDDYKKAFQYECMDSDFECAVSWQFSNHILSNNSVKSIF